MMEEKIYEEVFIFVWRLKNSPKNKNLINYEENITYFRIIMLCYN